MNNSKEELMMVYTLLKNSGLDVRIDNSGEITFNLNGWKFEVTGAEDDQ